MNEELKQLVENTDLSGVDLNGGILKALEAIHDEVAKMCVELNNMSVIKATEDENK
jgi:hypothetical protein